MKKLNGMLQGATMLSKDEMKAISGGSQTFHCYALNEEGVLLEFDGWELETSISWCQAWNSLDYDCRCYSN